MSTEADFIACYPHGVLTEQEGGVPNDALNWEDAMHVCRKHRQRERVCVDARSELDGENQQPVREPTMSTRLAAEVKPPRVDSLPFPREVRTGPAKA